jgi:hypothetical protein
MQCRAPNNPDDKHTLLPNFVQTADEQRKRHLSLTTKVSRCYTILFSDVDATLFGFFHDLRAEINEQMWQ